jgi:hexosaminidase
MLKKIIFSFCLFLAQASGYSQQSNGITVIPRPSEVKTMAGTFSLSGNTTITADANCKNEANQLQNSLLEETGLKVRNSGKQSGSVVNLKIDKNQNGTLGKEGYTLEVNKNEVQITGASAAGVFYGIQTLRQLIKKSESGNNEYVIPCVSIEDKPRFSWRAFMLDEARYFKGIETVKSLLNEMALLKMNVFHWHLTDDQGWRVEIKKYPLLTSIGSKRDSTQIGEWNSKKYDGTKHEGYYTQDQIKNIIAYAAERHIVIIPEIEIPGHASAAIAAYPWLGSTAEAIKVPTTFGVHYNVYNVANPKVMRFLEEVLTEVIDLFPSKVIHIGGDEVKYDQWKSSSQVQEFMKQKGLSSPVDLQIWTTNKISNFLESKGRRMMGWNEIVGAKLHEYNDLEDNLVKEKLASSTLVHFWKGDLNLINDAISKGYDIVNSFHEYTYLDYGNESIPLSKAYSFDPVPKGLARNLQHKVVGMGCQMWGEWIPTVTKMNDMVYPRIAAYAEVGWTDASNKNYDAFRNALPFFYARWDKENINYNK